MDLNRMSFAIDMSTPVFQAVFFGAWKSSNDIRFRIHG
jgi:hypothetical protein